jgi:hypothetical protein
MMMVKAARSARDAINSGMRLRNGNALTNQAGNRADKVKANALIEATGRALSERSKRPE